MRVLSKSLNRLGDYIFIHIADLKYESLVTMNSHKLKCIVGILVVYTKKKMS